MMLGAEGVQDIPATRVPTENRLLHADRLVLTALHRGFDGRLPDSIAIAQGVTGWVAANRQVIVNADAALDLGDAAGIITPPLRLCASLPVLGFDEAEVAGALTVYSPYAFSESDRLLIERIANGIGASARDAAGADDSLKPTIAIA